MTDEELENHVFVTEILCWPSPEGRGVGEKQYLVVENWDLGKHQYDARMTMVGVVARPLNNDKRWFWRSNREMGLLPHVNRKNAVKALVWRMLIEQLGMPVLCFNGGNVVEVAEG